MCVTAAFDDQGRITRYVTMDMPNGESGIVTAYEPPTAASPGALVYNYK